MAARVTKSGLAVDARLAAFVDSAALPGTQRSADQFWTGFAQAVATLGPRIRAALATRGALQQQIDAWHIARRGQAHDPATYRAFLEDIGYLEPDGPDFTVETEGVDPEIALIAGPQLVVPVMNARYALNAANARWGSLYDALYGTDALGDLPTGKAYDPNRGARVIAWGRAFLDEAVPLAAGSHAAVVRYRIENGRLFPELRDPAQFVGFRGTPDAPNAVILRNHGLHIILRIDPGHRIGAQDLAQGGAGLADIRLEAALSAIMDLEDSIAAVDAEDKVAAYSNWLGLMRGDLEEMLVKDGRTITRRLAPDFDFTAPDGLPAHLNGRAVMLVRNVGHLMTTPAVLDPEGAEVSEGLLDAFITTLCAIHDLKKREGPRNSRRSAIYVVKPKLHGAGEVALTCAIFDAVEDTLALPRNTVKLGIMDEERRTSANLKACIRAARARVAFINTGFLDRTGDEIHTSMEAGPMVRKGAMKGQAWIRAYEDRNVDIGLACGLKSRAQIGKGMWAMPDLMAAMLDQKAAHPKAGASCAWVPSPTAATLHATHYHRTDVGAVQDHLAAAGPRATLDQLLTLPLADGANWSEAEIAEEVANNVQGILGYVVRWVDQGIGCSKVPDIHDIGLMEDRATCRISAQALANWLHHGVVGEAEVIAALRRMAVVVDQQNEGDPAYQPMSPRFDGAAFRAACDMIFHGGTQPSGYTEPLLHRWRAEVKSG